MSQDADRTAEALRSLAVNRAVERAIRRRWVNSRVNIGASLGDMIREFDEGPDAVSVADRALDDRAYFMAWITKAVLPPALPGALVARHERSRARPGRPGGAWGVSAGSRAVARPPDRARPGILATLVGILVPVLARVVAALWWAAGGTSARLGAFGSAGTGQGVRTLGLVPGRKTARRRGRGLVLTALRGWSGDRWAPSRVRLGGQPGPCTTAGTVVRDMPRKDGVIRIEAVATPVLEVGLSNNGRGVLARISATLRRHTTGTLLLADRAGTGLGGRGVTVPAAIRRRYRLRETGDEAGRGSRVRGRRSVLAARRARPWATATTPVDVAWVDEVTTPPGQVVAPGVGTAEHPGHRTDRSPHRVPVPA